MKAIRVTFVLSGQNQAKTFTAYQRRFHEKAREAARVTRYMALSQKHTKRDGGENRL